MVWGNPFDADKAVTEAVVIESIERAYNHAGTSFSTSPERVNPLVPHVAVVFNADHARSGLPCSDLSKLRPGSAPSGNVRVQVALCRGGTMLTGVQGVVEDVSGPDDPKFRQLVYQVAAKLFRKVFGGVLIAR